MLADKLCKRFQTYVLRKYSKMHGAILSLVITTGLVFSIPASAQFEPVQLTDRQAKRLSGKLCRTLIRYAENDQDKPIGEEIEEILLKWSRVDDNVQNYNIQIAHFFNINSDRIICKPNGNNSFPKQHFFIRAIRQDFPISLFKEYLFSDAIFFPIDPNVVTENQYGEKETVLDYLDEIFSDNTRHDRYNMHQIREIREIIVNDFGGKRARELP